MKSHPGGGITVLEHDSQVRGDTAVAPTFSETKQLYQAVGIINQ